LKEKKAFKHLSKLKDDNPDALEHELIRMDQEIEQERGNFLFKSTPSSIKSGVSRRHIPLKTPSTNETIREEQF